MKRAFLGLILISLSSGCSPPPELDEDALNGKWVGSFEVEQELAYLKVEIQAQAGDTKLTVEETLWADPTPVTGVRLNSPHLHFELPRGSTKLIFDGRLDGDTISGTLRSGYEQGEFQLVRQGQVDPNIYDDYIGAYEFESGRFVFIGRYDFLTADMPHVPKKSWLYYVKDSGRTGLLIPSSSTSFFSGRTFFVPVPTEVDVSFVRNQEGAVSGLRWKEKGVAEVMVSRSELYTEEEVVFQSGKVTLAGRLLVPSTEGPHPAVVVVSGGNGTPVNRNQGYQIVSDIFARHGIASLVYDKRGGGKSTGEWRTAGPEELAADALGAVHFLLARDDINPNQVGLWGISEFAWFGPLAASRSKELAFLILVSTDGVSRFESNIMWLEQQWLPSEGFSPQEIEEAVAFSSHEHQFARSDKGWEKLEATVEKSRDKTWFPYTQMGSRGVTSRDHWFWKWYGLWADHDPALALRKVKCPVLAIWGETEGRLAEANVETPLREAGHQDYTIKVFPKGGHGLWLEKEYGRWNSVRTYVPGYFDTMTDWILKRVDVTQ